MEPVKYINNKDFLREIHLSKNTYCAFTDPKYSEYDAIVHSLDELTPEFIAALCEKKGKIEDALVFRVMMDGHVPEHPEGKKRKKGTGTTTLIRTVFDPFRHFISRDGQFVEVGRSHWIGSIETGKFSGDHGKMTNRLAYMYMLLVRRISLASRWRAYSYVDEMRSHALVQLSQVGLQFNEAKSDNPFAFYTQVVINCFERIRLVEKKNQRTRDELLIAAGVAPSFACQIEHEIAQRFETEAAIAEERRIELGLPEPELIVIATPPKRVRKPKAVS